MPSMQPRIFAVGFHYSESHSEGCEHGEDACYGDDDDFVEKDHGCCFVSVVEAEEEEVEEEER